MTDRIKRMQLCVARVVDKNLRCQRCDVLYSNNVIPVSNLCIDFCELCARLSARLAATS